MGEEERMAAALKGIPLKSPALNGQGTNAADYFSRLSAEPDQMPRTEEKRWQQELQEMLAKPEEREIHFIDEDHRKFYMETIATLTDDCYHRALVYTLGLSPDARKRFSSIYDAQERSINPAALYEPWQTSGSSHVTRLAFQLFTDGVPSAFIDPSSPDIDECRRYSVSDIFACGFAPYFFEADSIRYPEYTARR
jgi:hypothetical protein